MISTSGLCIKALKKEPFSGSHHGMRYYLTAKDDVLSTFIYPEPWAFNKTPDAKKERQDFPFTQEGLDEAIAWLNQSFESRRSHWELKERDKMKALL